jgi:hypothetical protein
VTTGKDDIRRILRGERPADAILAGATLDGRELSVRDRIVPWDLSGLNLRGTVFTRLDLSRASFAGADLSGAAFRNVNLQGAGFARIEGAGAIFEDVNLAYASFRDADLRGAQFSLANLADIDFKRADLRGATVNGVRFSLNGGTHALGLKEALRHRFGEVSYPFAAGVSGDAFWLSYLPETGALVWGGFPHETLRRGLTACGFESEFANVLDVEEAWRRLTTGLKAGHGAVTPLHVGGRWIAGSGFGGSEWVYVSGYEPGDNAVRVRCLLGDDLLYPWDEFVRSWCIHHPMEEDLERIVYTFCVVGERREEVTPGQAVLRGLQDGVAILDLGEFPTERAVCGIPVYDLLLRDLEVEPLPGEETVGWLGLGLMHHHGSRWAIRDFLLEAGRHLQGADEGLSSAIRAYERALSEIRTTMEILPPSLGGDGPEAEEAHALYLDNREQAGKHLRAARAAEREAREALLGVIETAEPA